MSVLHKGRNGIIRRLFVPVGIFAMFPATGLAVGNAETESGFGNFYGTLLKVILVLILIIICIVILIRFLAQKNRSWLGNRSARILSGIGLGPNKSLQLVEIGKSIYIIGVGDDVQLIEKITDPREVEEVLQSLNANQFERGSQIVHRMSDWLKTVRNPRQDDEINSEEELASFQEIFQKQMKHLGDRKQRITEVLEQKDPNARQDHKDGPVES